MSHAPSSTDLRRQFIDFFVEKHRHAFVPSSPVVPQDDPTLLFTNAGMNQFKPIFLGEETRAYTRAANSQKCIRAGGKHNDLDDVGKDTYHHTFFEMLGNWSFGDYFKTEAIDWAWELLVEQWGLDPERLHATYFEGDSAEGLEPDDEAKSLWLKYLPPGRVHPGNKKDNFWEMGDTGPCGPCSEIHFDRTPGKTGGPLVNGGSPDVIEIWNLVFIQFNRSPSGLTPLPAKHVDTGMGFERICAVLQNVPSNYDTDVFKPLLDKISELSGKPYGGKLEDPADIAFRAIADHARMATFSIADGAVPSNKKRGAVLRSVIRRASRFGYQVLGLTEPFLHELVPVVAANFGDFFPEVRQDTGETEQIVRGEEEDFLATIERGLKGFDEAAERASKTDKIISGDDIFTLHATHGFPADLTTQLADERGLSTDMNEYARLWDEHQKISGKGRKAKGQEAVDLSPFPPTDDSPKYGGLATESSVLGWVIDGKSVVDGKLPEDAEAAILLDRTTFYAEQGGQVSDVGTLVTPTGTFHVVDAERRGNHVLHHGQVSDGHVLAHQRVECRVDLRRADIMRNHTGTHLLNHALRRVLGDHVAQKGSLVDADRLRFDFDHSKAVTAEELAEVERVVNGQVYADLPVSATVMPLEEAKRIAGVRAVFGEKYPDPVRVVAVGEGPPTGLNAAETSVEFCGGTHLRRTGEIGFLKIVAEESVSKGVRRITAVTGRAAVEFVQKIEVALRTVGQSLSARPEEIPQRIAALQAEIAELKKKLKGSGGVKASVDTDALLNGAEPIGEAGKLIVAELPAGLAGDPMLGIVDSLKKRAESCAILLASPDDDGKVALVAAVSDDLIKRGLKAGDWVRDVAKVLGGGGGGRPQLAQAGGKDASKLPEALEAARAVASASIK